MPKITPAETPDPEEPTPVGVPDKLKPGKLFGSFELERELEQGSTGAVWLAQDYSVGRKAEQVVLRFLPERLGSDKAAVEKLKDEIQRRSALNHPNILHTYGVVESRGRVAIKMEYLGGQSLASLRLTKPNQVFEVRRAGNLGEEDVPGVDLRPPRDRINSRRHLARQSGRRSFRRARLEEFWYRRFHRCIHGPGRGDAQRSRNISVSEPATSSGRRAGSHRRFVFAGSNSL